MNFSALDKAYCYLDGWRYQHRDYLADLAAECMCALASGWDPDDVGINPETLGE